MGHCDLRYELAAAKTLTIDGPLAGRRPRPPRRAPAEVAAEAGGGRASLRPES